MEDAEKFLEELAQFDRPALQTQIANHSMSTNHSATFDRGSGSEDALLPRLGGSGARRRPTTGTAASQSQNGASAARLAAAGGDTGARDREQEQRRKEKKEKKEKRERKAKEREERDARRAERARAAAGADDGDVGSGVDEEAAAAEAHRQRIERHWQCPECRTLNARRTNKCRCGFDRELGTGSWLCPGCAILNQPQDGSSANFCPSCGHKRPEDSHAVGEVCELDVMDLTGESRATVQDSLSRKNSVIEVPPPRAAGAPAAAGEEAVVDEDAAMLGVSGRTEPTRLMASHDGDDADGGAERGHFSDSDEEGSSDSDSDYDSSDVDSAASWSESEADTENHPENRQSAEEQVESLTRSLAESSTGAHVVPANPPATMVDAGLKPFQLQGLQWMLDREADTLKLQFRGGLLADLMGMGKTRMLISLIEATRHAQTAAGAGVFLNRVRSYGTLIVCPLSLMSQWVQEIRHTVKDKVRVLRYHGPRAKRLSIFDVAEQFDVVLTTYQTLACEFRAGTAHRPSKLHSIEWYRVILDEAHNIRNPRSRQSRACVHLNGGRRWAVTATPLQNSLNDFHPIAKFLNIPGFGFRSWWIANVCQDSEGGTKRLQVIFSKMMLRRTFNTPGPDGQPLVVLPRKEIHLHEIEMEAEERAFYKEVFWWAKKRVDAANRGVNQLLAFATGLEMLVRCRQAANHKCLAVMAMQKKMGVDTTNSRQPNAQRRSPTTANPAGQQQPPVATTVTVDPTLQDALQKAQREADEALSAEAQARAAAKAALEAFIKKVKPKMLRSEFVDQVLDKLLENEGKMPDEEECTICMDTMTNPCVLRCGHTFCGGCVVLSLEHQPRCPQCRTQVSPKQCFPLPGTAGEAGPNADDEETKQKESLAAAERRRRRGKTADFSSEDSDEESKLLPRLERVEIGPMSEWQPSSKMVRIVELIRAAEPDEKFVVMSHFTAFLRAFAAVLDREEISHVMYHGGLDVRERDKVVRRFHVPHVVTPSENQQQQQGADAAPQAPPAPAAPAAAGGRQRNSQSPGPRIMLATIQSCGVGLNLCAASQLVVADPSWNPAIESQAYSRIHRIGQTRDVKIHRLIAKETIDVKVQKLAESKAHVADMCMDSSRAARLGRQELMELFGGERRRRRRRDREQGGDALDDRAPPEQPPADP